jgi:hypothetical protein
MAPKNDDDKSVPGLLKQFVKNPDPFLASDSSRATPLGQVWCRCSDISHTRHRPEECGAEVFNDGLCRECYAHLHGST